LARRLGWTEDQIQNLGDFEKRSDFTPSEKAALRLAEIETLRPQEFTDAMWEDLRKYFDEGEIVELTAAIGLFNYFNRANDVLMMDPTKPGEGAPPGSTTGS
jgi:alkylhydroperoxidase family enzyme